MTEIMFRAPEPIEIREAPEPASMIVETGKERYERHKADGKNGLTRKAIRATAGERAIRRLVDRHRNEFEQLLDDEHAVAGTDDLVRARADRLIRAGLSAPVAEAFARDAWPVGEIVEGIVLDIEDE